MRSLRLAQIIHPQRQTYRKDLVYRLRDELSSSERKKHIDFLNFHQFPFRIAFIFPFWTFTRERIDFPVSSKKRFSRHRQETSERKQ